MIDFWVIRQRIMQAGSVPYFIIRCLRLICCNMFGEYMLCVAWYVLGSCFGWVCAVVPGVHHDRVKDYSLVT